VGRSDALAQPMLRYSARGGTWLGPPQARAHQTGGPARKGAKYTVAHRHTFAIFAADSQAPWVGMAPRKSAAKRLVAQTADAAHFRGEDRLVTSQFYFGL
jgi:hypothetical protein